MCHHLDVDVLQKKLKHKQQMFNFKTGGQNHSEIKTSRFYGEKSHILYSFLSLSGA